jgi:hypothetical protein
MLTTGVWGDLSPEVGDLLLNIGVWGDLSPEVGDLWRGPTPTGPAPHYVIGPAGLMKLLDVLRVLEKH